MAFEEAHLSLKSLEINTEQTFNVTRASGEVDNDWTIAVWSRLVPRVHGPVAWKSPQGWRIFMHRCKDKYALGDCYAAGWRRVEDIWPTNVEPENIDTWRTSFIETMEKLASKTV